MRIVVAQLPAEWVYGPTGARDPYAEFELVAETVEDLREQRTWLKDTADEIDGFLAGAGVSVSDA